MRPNRSGKKSVPGDAGVPRPALCGDVDLRIGRDGTWFHHGAPIGRKSLIKLFSSVLRRDEYGEYWLETPAEKARIQVEDAPFLAVDMVASGAGRNQSLSFITNVDEIVTADAAHPIRVETAVETGEPLPYLLVRNRLEARINRAVFYDLVERGAEELRDGGKIFGVWSAGAFFPLGRLDEE